MFYSMYLSSLCERRRWPDPHYEPYQTRHGHYCKVRVNNREYCTDVPYKTEALARDGAATKAFMICRNFSANDGMYPGQRPGQSSASGVVQGRPVAIGSGRGPMSNRNSDSSYDTQSSDGGSSSGGNSPKSFDSGFEQQLRQVMQQMPRPRATPRKNAPLSSSSRGDEYVCLCRRAAVRAYGRCNYCLRENGWA